MEKQENLIGYETIKDGYIPITSPLKAIPNVIYIQNATNITIMVSINKRRDIFPILAHTYIISEEYFPKDTIFYIKPLEIPSGGFVEITIYYLKYTEGN